MIFQTKIAGSPWYTEYTSEGNILSEYDSRVIFHHSNADEHSSENKFPRKRSMTHLIASRTAWYVFILRVSRRRQYSWRDPSRLHRPMRYLVYGGLIRESTEVVVTTRRMANDHLLAGVDWCCSRLPALRSILLQYILSIFAHLYVSFETYLWYC